MQARVSTLLVFSPRRRFRLHELMRRLCIAACSLFLLSCPGCALLPLSTLGTVFDIAGSAVQAAPEVFESGKLDTAFNATLGQVRVAVDRANNDLQTKMTRNKADSPSTWDFQLVDRYGMRTEVTLDERSPKLCRCRVNVGLWGPRPTAELVVLRIVAHLPPGSSLLARQPASRP